MDYCQFLFLTQTNYTLTYFAQHAQGISHDAINRYLKREKLTPALLWEHSQKEIVPSEKGYLIFDDTVLDKSDSSAIELTRWQYSGNAKEIVLGIGVVTCIYYNPELERFWAIDYRIYAPDEDGKTKINHVYDMLQGVVYSKKLLFKTVLMDTWYGVNFLMKEVDRLGKTFYCTIRSNRLVARTDQKYSYVCAQDLPLTEEEENQGVRVHLRRFPFDKHLRLFRIQVSPYRTEHVLTNDLGQISRNAAQKEYGIRSKIEQLHREIKQTTGIEKCQCRKRRIQRNHIACAFLVWSALSRLAHQAATTVYKIKTSLLENYLTNQLRNPSIKLDFA